MMKQNEKELNETFLIGYTTLELGNLLVCRTYYGVLQPFFDHEKLQLHYMDTETFFCAFLL